MILIKTDSQFDEGSALSERSEDRTWSPHRSEDYFQSQVEISWQRIISLLRTAISQTFTEDGLDPRSSIESEDWSLEYFGRRLVASITNTTFTRRRSVSRTSKQPHQRDRRIVGRRSRTILSFHRKSHSELASVWCPGLEILPRLPIINLILQDELDHSCKLTSDWFPLQVWRRVDSLHLSSSFLTLNSSIFIYRFLPHPGIKSILPSRSVVTCDVVDN